MATKSNKAIKISQKHLLGIQDLSINDVNLILNESQSFIKLNQSKNIVPILGGEEAIPAVLYDCIIANINRNILLADIPTYTAQLEGEGRLYLSGFYQEDLPLIDQACQDQGLVVSRTMTKNNWVAGIWVKP